MKTADMKEVFDLSLISETIINVVKIKLEMITECSDKVIKEMTKFVALGLTKYENDLNSAEEDLRNHLTGSQVLISKNSDGQIVGFCIFNKIHPNVIDISLISPKVSGIDKEMLTKVAKNHPEILFIVGATQNGRMLGCARSAFGKENMISPSLDPNSTQDRLIPDAFVRGIARLKTRKKEIDPSGKIDKYYGETGIYNTNINLDPKSLIKIDTSKTGDAYIFPFLKPFHT